MISPLLSLLLSTAYLGDLDRPSSHLINQNFGLGLRPGLVFSRYGYYPPSVFYRPWADLLREEEGGDRGVSSVTLDKDTYKLTLDVQLFKPEEIDVKVVDKYIVVEAKHEEKKDEHGLVSRQFVRRYIIPENVDVEKISSTISSDGVLTIQAPVKNVPVDENIKKIKIVQTGKPAIEKKPEETKDQGEKKAEPTSSKAEPTSSTADASSQNTTAAKN